MSDSLRPHGLQHTRPPCPSPSPRVCPSSCPFNQWCHPTISSSVALFSFCLQSFPAWGSFPMSWLFAKQPTKVLELQLCKWILTTFSFFTGLGFWQLLQCSQQDRIGGLQSALSFPTMVLISLLLLLHLSSAIKSPLGHFPHWSLSAWRWHPGTNRCSLSQVGHLHLCSLHAWVTPTWLSICPLWAQSPSFTFPHSSEWLTIYWNTVAKLLVIQPENSPLRFGTGAFLRALHSLDIHAVDHQRGVRKPRASPPCPGQTLCWPLPTQPQGFLNKPLEKGFSS